MALLPAIRSTSSGRMAARRDHPLERLRNDFDTLFGRLVGGWLAPFDQDVGSMRLWDFDVNETDQEIVVRAELPGFEPNELDVQVSYDTLIIKAEKEQKTDGKEERQAFYRSVTIPSGVDAEKVQANYQNGVLELHMPRTKASQPKHIKVQGAQSNGSESAQQGGSGGTQAGANAEQATGAGTKQTKK